MGTVQDILQRKGSSVASIEGHGTVRDAARVMNAKGVGTLVVREEDGVVGILSQRDIVVRVFSAPGDPGALTIRQVMTSPVACCAPQTTLDDVCKIMMANHIAQVPVMKHERLAGIVTSHDLLVQRISEGLLGTTESLCAYTESPSWPWPESLGG
jgi:CBS domain-containing protein